MKAVTKIFWTVAAEIEIITGVISQRAYRKRRGEKRRGEKGKKDRKGEIDKREIEREIDR